MELLGILFSRKEYLTMRGKDRTYRRIKALRKMGERIFRAKYPKTRIWMPPALMCFFGFNADFD
jgi:hypothetical protein